MGLTNRARQLRKDSTNAEQRLWFLLRSRQFSGFKLRRQQPIGHYIVDLVCQEQRLIVEADGGQHFADGQPDAARDAWLTSVGYRVLRFGNGDIFNATEGVGDTILAALRADPSPPPFPSRGEGAKPR